MQYILTALLLCLSLAVPQQPILSYFAPDEPLTLRLSIFNSSSVLLSHSFPLLYSLQQQQITANISFPLSNHTIADYNIKAELFKEGEAAPVQTNTMKLARMAKIRGLKNNEQLMMMEGIESKAENASMGLHVPSKFSILVLYQQGNIGNLHEYRDLLGFRVQRVRNGVVYIPPIDMSQLKVAYKTYRWVESLPEHDYNMTLSIQVYSATYYSSFFGLARPEVIREISPVLAEFYSEENIDMMKELLFTNHLYLAVAWFSLTMVQMLMSIFAFKSEIEAWNHVQEKGGLSIKVLYQRVAIQLIVLLYLIDKDSPKIYIISILFNFALSCWKIMRAVEVSVSSRFPFISVGYKEWYHRKTEQIDNSAIHITNKIMVVMFALFLCYEAYSLWVPLEDWALPSWRKAYSLTLEISMGFIIVFGFVMMLPQLIINYKLKSVDHLPAKALFYRFISAIIDDIFVFMIDLPLLQRLRSFDDDVVFIVYLIQRRIYKVDPNRKGSMMPTAAPPIKDKEQ